MGHAATRANRARSRTRRGRAGAACCGIVGTGAVHTRMRPAFNTRTVVIALAVSLAIAAMVLSPHVHDQPYGGDAPSRDGQITVLNPKSYPTVGGYWTVDFETRGTHDLAISAAGGTTFGDSAPGDVGFVELACGGSVRDAPVYDGVVTFEDYACGGTASLVLRVHTPGAHDVRLNFGADTAHASNNAYPRSAVEINDNTDNGPALSNNNQFGISVAAIGDLDGDGVPDLAAGANSDRSARGAVFVMFMNDDGSVRSTAKINDQTANGPALDTSDNFGRSVAAIGDLDGDGVQDLAAGAFNDDAGGSNYGAVHIMFMNDDGSVKGTVEINGTAANGPALSANDYFGASVAGIGDLDGDGVQDLAAGADGDRTDRGAVFVMFMNDDGSVRSTAKINDQTANGPALDTSDNFGISVAAIGDLDGDGVQDLAAGARRDDGGGSDSGVVHIMFMNRDGTVKGTVEINGTAANGPALSANDYFGASVAGIGDLDGDGVQDLAAGANLDDAGGSNRGAVHVMFMNRDGTVKGTVEINGNTSNGPDLDNSDEFGISVAAMGDLDGDGVPDLAAGAYRDDAGGDKRGAVHIIHINDMRTHGNGSVDSTVAINDNTTNGPALSNGDRFGVSVAAIGDLDGDGVQDLAAGAYHDSTGGSQRGAVHVMFMNSDGTVKGTAVINRNTSNGPTLSNEDHFGRSVAAIGDLDGDGVPDIAAGANQDGGSDHGAVHVMFMNSNGTVKDTVEINRNTSNGPTLSNGDWFGLSVAAIGDLDGDGVQDLAAGAVGDDAGGDANGAVHIMFMNRDGTVKGTAEINDNTSNGPALSNLDEFGSSVAAIGDLDGDGVQDLAAGAYSDNAGGSNRGAVHVMFMNRDGTVKGTVEINDNTDNGPALSNEDHFGRSVAAIGDLDGDGVPDLAAGASQGGGSNRGAVYVMFMNGDGTVKETVKINDSTANGPTLSNNDYFGISVAAIGDLDGDGAQDLAAGALLDDSGGSDRGAVHVMFMDKEVLVRSVSSTAPDGTYGAGQAVDIAVKFSEPVSVTGTPQLALDVSPQPRTASYLSGSGTDTLAFRYMVQQPDEAPDLQYVSEGSLELNGGTITALESPGEDAILDLPDPGARFNYNPPGAFGSLALNSDVEVSAPPTMFSSATLDLSTGVLEVTFDRAVDASSIAAAKFHIREAGAGRGGVTLSSGELDTAADSDVISFTLTAANLAAVEAMADPKLVIDPAAVEGFGATFDVSTAAFTQSFNVMSKDTLSQGVTFSADGTKMFVAGNAKDSVHEYALSTAFDLSNVTFTRSLNVSSIDMSPQDVAFSNDGAKMFVVGAGSGSVHEYALSAAFDLSGASFTRSFSVASKDTIPTGVAFSNDGAKMFVVGTTSDSVHEYALSAAFDLSGASLTRSFTVDVENEDDPGGVAFSGDGAKMFVAGNDLDSVHEYALSTAFDISTASFARSFDVSSKASSVTGVAFSSDGAKMFVVENNASRVHEYALSSAFDITITGDASAFLTTWETASANQTVTIPAEVHAGQTLTVDWGDGTVESFTADGDLSHRYESAGSHQVSMTGGLSRIDLGVFDATASLLKSIDQWGGIGWSSMERAFQFATQATYNATDAPDLSGVDSTANMFHFASKVDGDLSGWDVSSVTDMNEMFLDAGSFNGDLSGWDISSVEDMESMFSNAASFNGDISSWNVSSVKDASSMFRGAASFNGDLSGWDVSSVTDMAHMFSGAVSFNGDLSGWDVSSVTDMFRMFAAATSFNQPLSSWNVSSVTDMTLMFQNADAFDQNLGAWYVVLDNDSVQESDLPGPVGTISAQNAFLDAQNPTYGTGSAPFTISAKQLSMGVAGAGAYEAVISVTGSNVFGSGNNLHTVEVVVTPGAPFVTTWTVVAGSLGITIPGTAASGGTYTVDWGDNSTGTATGDVSHTYGSAGTYTVSLSGDLASFRMGSATAAVAQKLTSIEQWGDIRWTTMQDAFRSASNMIYNATDAPDLSGAISMQNMFRDASSFDGDLSSWDVSGIQNMDGTFRGASSFNGDISSWNTESATDMRKMFQDADAFNQPLSGWDVSDVTHTDSMFFGAASFNQSLNTWDVSSVTRMQEMFLGADAFNQPLSSWDVSAVTSMKDMFSAATSFNQPLDSWNVSSVTGMSGMFWNAFAFNQPLDSWDVSSVTGMNGMFLNADSFNQPLNNWNVSSVTTMFNMFSAASSFNQPLSSWNVSSVTDMNGMFQNAASFDQNLGAWYVVLDNDSVQESDLPGLVGTISAQNTFLDGQNPVYGTDSAPFTISAKQLSMDAADAGTYEAVISVTGSNVFESGNNLHAVEVVVTPDGAPPPVQMPGTGSAPELHVTKVRGTVPAGITSPNWGSDTRCYDAEDGDITYRVTTSVSFSNDRATITYSCTDSDGNTDTAAVTGRAVTNTDRPKIFLNGEARVYITEGSTYSDAGAYCIDDVDGRFGAVTDRNTVDTGTPGTYQVHYMCTDSHGNTAGTGRYVHVEPAGGDLRPTLAVQEKMTIRVGDTFTAPSATCTDPEDGDISGRVIMVEGNLDVNTPGGYDAVYYICRDSGGNEVIKGLYVTVLPR